MYNVYILSLTARCPPAAGLHSRRPTLTASSQGVARPLGSWTCLLSLLSRDSQLGVLGCFLISEPKEKKPVGFTVSVSW